jgi:tRNA-splicing ligase RtcB
MKEGILICKGLGNQDWNQSCAHGCGRIMSRERAASEITLKDYEKDMEGIYSTSVVRETIDESRFAYKPSELIKQTILKTVEIVEQLRPILNIKAL